MYSYQYRRQQKPRYNLTKLSQRSQNRKKQYLPEFPAGRRLGLLRGLHGRIDTKAWGVPLVAAARTRAIGAGSAAHAQQWRLRGVGVGVKETSAGGKSHSGTRGVSGGQQRVYGDALLGVLFLEDWHYHSHLRCRKKDEENMFSGGKITVGKQKLPTNGNQLLR